MHDHRPLAAEQAEELDEAAQVLERIERTAHMLQRHEANARAAAGIAEEAVAVRGDDDVELPRQRREQGRHVRLGPAGLRERDQQQNARARHPPNLSPRARGDSACAPTKSLQTV